VYCEREKRGGGLREKGRRSNNSWVVCGAYETIPPITGDNGWGGRAVRGGHREYKMCNGTAVYQFSDDAKLIFNYKSHFFFDKK
jgi:hypothetical protein